MASQLGVLAERGWALDRPYDMCWLDCTRDGYLKTWRDQVICLCIEHALVLESGFFNGDYDGAPLPEDSLVPDWYWQPADHFAAA